MTESKTDRAHDYLSERINSGNFGPGYRLVLGKIAQELDMSVVPVREAIRRLEAEGLVTFERNVGAQVALIKEAEYEYTLETLALVEGSATALAAPHLTGDQIARARAINDQMVASLTEFDPHQFTELNREFHSVLFEECTNPHILDLVHRGWNRMNVLRDSSFSFIPGRALASTQEHEHLLHLIESGAHAYEVEVAARGHKLGTLTAMQNYQTTAHGAPATAAASLEPTLS